MKIALTCPASLPATQFGGILFLALDIAKNLSHENEVTIYTTDLDFSDNSKRFNKKLPRIEKVEKFLIKRFHVIFAVKLFFVNPSIYKSISHDKPDIIHAISVRSFQALIAALISKFNNIPLILSDQGGLFTHPDYKENSVKSVLYKVQEPLIKFIIKQSKKIIVANEYEYSIFSKYCDSSKLEIIRNAIDIESLEKNPFDFKKKYKIEGRIILFLGRFAKVKGVDILLDSFSNLIKDKKNNDVRLVIMGSDFGYKKELLDQIEELNLNMQTMIIENPSRQDVIAAYHASNFLVLPSRWEMSPLTPLEGFACKKTTISTKIHGIPYVIKDRENGILCELENIVQFTHTMQELLDDENIAREYGMNGYKFVKQECNSKIMSEKLFSIYSEATKQK
jgi:glycosyltransferase involved in cell wall biosynthesis